LAFIFPPQPADSNYCSFSRPAFRASCSKTLLFLASLPSFFGSWREFLPVAGLSDGSFLPLFVSRRPGANPGAAFTSSARIRLSLEGKAAQGKTALRFRAAVHRKKDNPTVVQALPLNIPFWKRNTDNRRLLPAGPARSRSMIS